MFLDMDIPEVAANNIHFAINVTGCMITNPLSYDLQPLGHPQELFQREKFKIDGTGTYEGTENKNRPTTAKSLNISKCFKVSLIVS